MALPFPSQLTHDCVSGLEDPVELAAAGVIENVCKGMAAHRASPQAQEEGCRALAALASCFRSLGDELAAAGAAFAVLEGMQAHLESDRVQEGACSALLALARFPRLRVQFGEIGAMACVAEALERHRLRPHLVVRGLGALKNMAADPGNQRAVMDDGAIGAAVDVMGAHVRNATVQEAGMRVRNGPRGVTHPPLLPPPRRLFAP